MWRLLLFIILIPGSEFCKFGSDENKRMAVTTTMTPQLYNCSYNKDQGNPVEVFVRNVTNSTQLLCLASLVLPENISIHNYGEYEDQNNVPLCNKLGSSVCPNCGNDTTRGSYKEVIENITLSCQKEEVTTTMARTTAISTTQAYESTTEATTEAVEEATTSSKAREVAETGFGTVEIVSIACGGTILTILIFTALITHKRTKERKSDGDDALHGKNQQEVIRFEADTGDLYASVGKTRNTSQTVENVLYGTAQGNKNTKNEELYTQVDLKRSANVAANSQRLNNPNHDKDLYSKVDEQRS